MRYNKTLISYAIIGILLISFGFYSSTMNYADAISTQTFTINSFDLRGSSYQTASNSWFFVSPNNNTLIQLTDNTTSPTTKAVNQNGNCADPHNVLPLSALNGAYIAIYCKNAVISSNGVLIKDRITNQEKDFESGITNTNGVFDMVEWKNGNKFYTINHGSSGQQIAIFNIGAINSTTQTMFLGTVNLSVTCANTYDAIINEQTNEMYISCTHASTRDAIIIFDLVGSIIKKTLFLVGSASTGNIDFNSKTNDIVVSQYDNNDVFVVDAITYTPIYNNTAYCSTGLPLQPAVNENNNQAFILCNNTVNGANQVEILDIGLGTKGATLPVATGQTGLQGGSSNNWMSMHWEDLKSALYITYGWVQTGSGATLNSITRIQDTTGSTVGATVCIDTTGDTTVDLCFTDTNGDGVADSGQQVSLGTYRTGSNFTEFGNDVFCAFGINENACNNRNVQTNGVGYAFTILIIVFSYALLVSIHIMGQKMLQKENIQVVDALNIHPVLLLVMLIFDVGLAFSLGFIDNVIFYTTIVVLIGLAGFGIYRKVVSG